MGLGIGISRTTKKGESIPSGNPDPYHFHIIQHYEENNILLLKVRYPGCSNYEGEKILLMRGTMSNFTKLDPHFDKYSNLIARFVPNAEGWNLGLMVLKNLCNKG